MLVKVPGQGMALSGVRIEHRIWTEGVMVGSVTRRPHTWRSRRATIGMAVAVTLGAGGLVAALPTRAAPADDGVLTPAELCALFPSNFDLDAASNRCEGTWNGCERDLCSAGTINPYRDPADAAGTTMQTPGFTPVPGFGENAVERVGEDGVYWLKLQRDRYVVSVYSVGDVNLAKSLATHIDQQLVSALGIEVGDAASDDAAADDAGDPTGTGDAEDDSGTGDAASSFDPALGIDALLSGSETSPLRGILINADLGRYLSGCEGDETDWRTCEPEADRLSASVAGQAVEAFGTPPSDYEERLIDVLYTAVLVENLVGDDGKPLFPSVVQGLPLVMKLLAGGVDYRPDGETPVPVARRVIEMLMATDAGQWDRRFGS